jgi:hypothetical protein
MGQLMLSVRVSEADYILRKSKWGFLYFQQYQGGGGPYAFSKINVALYTSSKRNWDVYTLRERKWGTLYFRQEQGRLLTFFAMSKGAHYAFSKSKWALLTFSKNKGAAGSSNKRKWDDYTFKKTRGAADYFIQSTGGGVMILSGRVMVAAYTFIKSKGGC